MTVLIYSTTGDLHADAVLWGLEKLGAECHLWPAGEFPAAQRLSIYSAHDCQRCSIEHDGRSLELDKVSVFWNRRSASPLISPALDVRDRDYVEQQSQQHLDALLSVICPDALWVNPIEVARAEVNKPHQLRIAQEVGLNIPPTLCSNSPAEIRDFYHEQDGAVVFKSYKLGGWVEGGRDGPLLVSYTTLVNEGDLEDDATLSFAPGIFQRLVNKSFEVRTTIIGEAVFSGAIRTPNQRVDDVDWRLQAPQHLSISTFVLPSEIENKLRMFMRRTGMVFCSFDLIFTPDHECFFLEANQMGQFLWKEEKADDLPLLDAMCRFLASGDPAYRWTESGSRLHYQDYIRTSRHKRLGQHSRIS